MKICKFLNLFKEELAALAMILLIVITAIYGMIGWIDSSHQDSIDTAISHQAYLEEKQKKREAEALQAKWAYISPADQVIIDMKQK